MLATGLLGTQPHLLHIYLFYHTSHGHICVLSIFPKATSCHLLPTAWCSHQTLVHRGVVARQNWPLRTAFSQELWPLPLPSWKLHLTVSSYWSSQPVSHPTKVRETRQTTRDKAFMISPPCALRTESKTPRSKTSNSKFRGSDNALLVTEA